jgi:predicted RNA polymerase sigma factor
MVNLGELHRREYGHLPASLLCAVKDFDVAEDALQEAFAAARYKRQPDLESAVENP